ncbi:hypothetical protein LINPERHAP1_LOCUS16717, partial [Linum perenne]
MRHQTPCSDDDDDGGGDVDGRGRTAADAAAPPSPPLCADDVRLSTFPSASEAPSLSGESSSASSERRLDSPPAGTPAPAFLTCTSRRKRCTASWVPLDRSSTAASCRWRNAGISSPPLLLLRHRRRCFLRLSSSVPSVSLSSSPSPAGTVGGGGGTPSLEATGGCGEEAEETAEQPQFPAGQEGETPNCRPPPVTSCSVLWLERR